jgi:nucleoside diphosphate kinase
MTEALSSIDDYPNIFSEIGNFIESLTFAEKKSLEEMSLTILGPEVILGLEFPQILRRIYHSGIFVVDFLIGLLNEEQIELLYKYHVPDSFLSTFRVKNVDPGGEDYAHLAKSVPVRNWRLLRRRFELGPSFVAILRKPGDSAAAALKALKGPSDPADLESESDYLRSSMDNPCFCRIHSSDDTVSVVREAQIFFGAQRFNEAIRKEMGIPLERLVEVLYSNVPNLQEFRSPVVLLKIKLRLLYLSHTSLQPLENLYRKYLPIMLATHRGPELLRLFTNCIRDEQRCWGESFGLLLDEPASVLAALADPKRVRSTGIEALMGSKVMKEVFMSEQERLLIETAIAYYRDFE